ncbi:hypothetical protein E3P99_01567 [Wallemia hederae]|uniref:F-box domain-containing protein n=1 Tax=Wallemia hederae TaxID=1540922 RepID=A0A4T0FP41_9BASI|nr:hypothetical protein E3P99_01567 [Wallemia hederae]
MIGDSGLEQLVAGGDSDILNHLDVADLARLSQTSRALRQLVTRRCAGRIEQAKLEKELTEAVSQHPSCHLSISSSAHDMDSPSSKKSVTVNLNTSDGFLLVRVIDTLARMRSLHDITIFTTHSSIAVLQLVSLKIDFTKLSQLAVVVQGAGITHLTDAHIGHLYHQLVLTFSTDFEARELVESMRTYFYHIRPFCLVNYDMLGVSVQFRHKRGTLSRSSSIHKEKHRHAHKRSGSNSIVYIKDDCKRLCLSGDVVA